MQRLTKRNIKVINHDTGQQIDFPTFGKEAGEDAYNQVSNQLTSLQSQLESSIASMSEAIVTDKTLTIEDAPADAKATGDAINNLRGAVGSPLVAATAASMTDTNKVYVYTGSETGYTSGNWYYHDGTSWVSGGVYNSVAVDLDSTLTLANKAPDSKVVGDAISSLNEDITNSLLQNVDLFGSFHSLVNYGYTASSEQQTVRNVTAKNCCNRIFIDGNSASGVGYTIRITNGIKIMIDNSTVKSLDTGIALKTNHLYRLTLVHVNGIMNGSMIAATVYKTGTSSTSGTRVEYTSDKYVREFIAEENAIYNVCLYFYGSSNTISFENAEFSLVMEDVTEKEELNEDFGVVVHGIDKDFIGTPGPNGNWIKAITNGFYVGQKYTFTNNSTVPLQFTFRDDEGNAINLVTANPGVTKTLVLTGLPTRLNIYSGGAAINCHIKSEYGLMDRVLINEGRIQDMSYITEDENNLYIGELINGHLTATGVVDDNYTDYRLSSKDIVALPSGSARIIRVKIAEGYLVAIRSGVRSDNLSHNLYWYKDGDTIIIPPGDNYYAISCCVDVGPTSYTTVKITTDDIPKMHLGLYIHKYGDDSDEDSEKILNAARLTFNSASNPNTLYSMPVIAHTSDCHGDYSRVKNFLGFCDRIHADLAAITGDLVSYRPYQGLGWFKELVNNANTTSAVCVGNHDAYDSTTTDEDVYNLVFNGITEKIGNTTGKTWYYKDVTDKSLRIISVNLYEYGGTTRNYTHFSNEQLTWLCDTLAGTPSGYGVILLYHSPQVNLNSALSSQYDKFFQVTRRYTNIYSGVTGSPINDIIDAFIGRTTISKTYTQTGTPSSISVTADFSAVDNSVEFIAHLTGHFHQDTVCYIPGTTHTQLMLNVICTNAIYGGVTYPYLCDLADLPRNNEDATQNSFNVYVIDRTAKAVKIIRVGSNTTYDMKKRDYMVIPYS